jgi:exosortase/archaeosortase family protein
MAPVSGRHQRGRHAAARPRSQRQMPPWSGWQLPIPAWLTGRLIRLAAMVLLAATGLALVVFQYQFRHLEAVAAAGMLGVLTTAQAASSAPIVWFGLGSTGAFGLVITPDCSSALLLVPLCGLGVLLLIPRKLPVGRIARALAVAGALLVTGNMLRIGVIAAATRLGGIGAGYQFGHLVLGSLISVVFIAASLILLIVIVVGRDFRPVRTTLSRHRRHAS